MSVIVECRVSAPHLVLSDALAAVPDATVNVEREIGTDPDHPLLFFWVSGDVDAFHDAMLADGSVRDETVLDRFPERRLYRVQFADPGAVLYGTYVELGAVPLSISGDADGWSLEMRFPDRGAVSAFRDRCTDLDLSFELDSLYRGRDGRDRDVLTRPQREALRAAVDSGYFAVPREATLEDLAAQLDISRQATSERIRRAVAALAHSETSAQS